MRVIFRSGSEIETKPPGPEPVGALQAGSGAWEAASSPSYWHWQSPKSPQSPPPGVGAVYARPEWSTRLIGSPATYAYKFQVPGSPGLAPPVPRSGVTNLPYPGDM